MNESILNYIRQNRSTYTREAITGELLKAGYNPAEVEAAWQAIEAEQLPSAGEVPPWAGTIGQFPPGPVPGQTPPPDPFAGQQAPPPGETWQATPGSSSAQQSTWQAPPDQYPGGSGQVPFDQANQPPGYGQPPPPQPGFILLDRNGRPIPVNNERSRGNQRFWLALAGVAAALFIGGPWIGGITQIYYLGYLIILLAVVIGAIVLWNRDRATARGLLMGLVAAVVIPVVLGFIAIVIIGGICVITGTRF